MSAVFKKLNLKDQTEIVVAAVPASFEPTIATLRGVKVRRAVGKIGFERVRMVAIDTDWSAVRFRRVGHIKTLTRGAEHAVSAAAKAKYPARCQARRRSAARR